MGGNGLKYIKTIDGIFGSFVFHIVLKFNSTVPWL